MTLPLKLRNALTAIRQIRAGEWVPRYNPISNCHLTAHRNGMELWLGNGAFFCEITPGCYFGLVWRHLVWWAAAKRLRDTADRPKRLLV